MSALSRGGLFASFEDDKEEVAAAEVVEDAQNVEADLGAAQDELNEAEEATRVVEQASDDADTLEEVADTLESREESGGATPEEIEMAEVTVESICNRLGIKKPVSLAAESFSSRSDRKRQTQLAVEGIREIGDSIWQVILKIYKKIREWIMKAWDYFFDARTKLLARAKALEARVDKVEGTPKESVIQGSFIEGLIHQGKFDPVGSLDKLPNSEEDLNTTVDILKTTESEFKDVVDEANENIKNNDNKRITVRTTGVNEKDGKEVEISTRTRSASALALSSIKMLGVVIAGTKEITSKNGKKARINGKYDIGSKAPVFVIDSAAFSANVDKVIQTVIRDLNGSKPKDVARTGGSENKISEVYDVVNKIKVQYADVGGKVNKDYKAPVLKEAEMSKTVSKCIDQLEQLETFNKQRGKITGSLQKIESLAANSAHVSVGKLNPNIKKAITSATKINTKVTQIFTTYLSMEYRYKLDVIRNMLDYVQKSLAQYKQDEDDED